jgi:membrane fusion protein, heavy metal efflux system
MMGRLGPVVIALLAGTGIGALVLPLSGTLRTAEEEQPKAKAVLAEAMPTTVKLTEAQMSAAGIDLAAVEARALVQRIIVSGTIVPHGDRIARVSVKLSATVAELRKRLGDAVNKDEVLAILESREVADAKSEYLAARLTNELQQELFLRDKRLWDSRVSSEQQFLRSRNAAAQTEMRLNIARQKLFALGLMETEISALPSQPETLLRRQEVRAPIAGHVVERKVDLGTAVGRDNLETELYVIVDLERVWIELAISPTDLPFVKEGQSVAVTARGLTKTGSAKVVFISPMVDKETRSARVVAEIDNSEGVWRPGSFVTAAIVVDEQTAPLVVPLGALQTVEDTQVVFVRTPQGFEKREVVLGRRDDRAVEIVSGVRSDEVIAASNTFALKAELMKPVTED